MSTNAYQNSNLPGIRKVNDGHGNIFIRKAGIKEMQPRRQLVEELKAKEPPKPANNPSK